MPQRWSLPFYFRAFFSCAVSHTHFRGESSLFHSVHPTRRIASTVRTCFDKKNGPQTTFFMFSHVFSHPPPTPQKSSRTPRHYGLRAGPAFSSVQSVSQFVGPAATPTLSRGKNSVRSTFFCSFTAEFSRKDA